MNLALTILVLAFTQPSPPPHPAQTGKGHIAPPAIVAPAVVPVVAVAPDPTPVPPTPTPPPPAPTFANSYAYGNCTWYVASRIKVPQDLGNANTWDDQGAAEGYTVSTAPKVGAVAQTDAGYFGHVALVEAIGDGQVEVKEMNVQGFGVVDEAWYSTDYFRYIYF